MLGLRVWPVWRTRSCICLISGWFTGVVMAVGRIRGTNSLRASSVHETQAEAVAAARRMLRSSGGGNLTIRRRDNKIQVKYAIEGVSHPPVRSLDAVAWRLACV